MFVDIASALLTERLDLELTGEIDNKIDAYWREQFRLPVFAELPQVDVEADTNNVDIVLKYLSISTNNEFADAAKRWITNDFDVRISMASAKALHEAFWLFFDAQQNARKALAEAQRTGDKDSWLYAKAAFEKYQLRLNDARMPKEDYQAALNEIQNAIAEISKTLTGK